MPETSVITLPAVSRYSVIFPPLSANLAPMKPPAIPPNNPAPAGNRALPKELAAVPAAPVNPDARAPPNPLASPAPAPAKAPAPAGPKAAGAEALPGGYN